MIADILPTLSWPAEIALGSATDFASPARGAASASTLGGRLPTTLRWSEKTIRQIAVRRGPRMSTFGMCCKALVRETWLRHVRRINFRTAQNHVACAAYSAMTVAEFADINRKQAWANWRSIPRNLSGRLPARPIHAIDLCCGIGESTAVLACYAAPGSHVLGLEYNPKFVEAARRTRYSALDGSRVAVAFRTQSVLEDFRDALGARVRRESIDLINASGAVGCHFAPADARRLARECGRVLKPHGLALVDSGYDGLDAAALDEIFADEGFEIVGRAVSCPLDRRAQLCLRRTV
ncbi:MAG: class I SAM-dependent methyltransferase [Pirellulales bacterium]